MGDFVPCWWTPPPWCLAMSRVIFVCPRWAWGRDAAGIRWLAARDAAEQPQRTGSSPQPRILSVKIPVTQRLRKPGGWVFYFYYWQLCGICVISILYKRARDVFRSWKSSWQRLSCEMCILLLPEQGSFLQTMQAQNCVLIELLDR